ncbi:MAG: hypothetical protein EPO08_04470 [Rhodospirillaceae bacterium]|nr:MAG: hypothetical protein EPO08_04470 [Rhodospirillaceae bacterium]
MAKKKQAPPEFLIQIEQVSGAVRPEMAPEKFIKGTKEALDQVSAMIESSCAAFVDRIGKLPAKKPSEIAIEFGVDVKAEAGIILTKGSLGANFKVSLKWTFG